MKVQNINPYITQKSNSKPAFKRNWQEHVSWGANYLKETGKTNFKIFSFPDAKVFVEVGNAVNKTFGSIKNRVVQLAATVGSAFTITGITSKDKDTTVYPMMNKGNGVFVIDGVDAKPGTDYRYIIQDAHNNIELVKDPYAKKQSDINGWSTVYDSDNYHWVNQKWIDGEDSRRIVRKPNEPMRGLEKLIIDEVNIPALTQEGTFNAAKKQVDVIAKRGVATAIELMPVENTFSKQWGYDGVDKFAVNEKLGGAKGLKELIDYAHGKGLNVIIDMVPNHMGPDGDYLAKTGPYEAGDGPFGAKLNYEGKNNQYVRDWMTNAALWWANEFKVDGIRFDMTKETASDFLLKQIVEELNEHNPQVFTIAEDGRDNKLSVTRYDDSDNSHKDKLDYIDMNIELIHSKNLRSTPHAIGFDSEWDFPLMHALKSAITHSNQTSLNDIDKHIKSSSHRVKYIMSHDEIGNVDGTRLIPKIVAQYLNLFTNIEGIDDADKGQKAAQLSQKLIETIVTNENISSADFAKLQTDYGLTILYDKKVVKTALMVALAKQRLAQGAIMTIPGPKMFFQGDDNAELAHFKFFREFSNEKTDRKLHPEMKLNTIRQKGYDTIIDEALPDSIIDRIKPSGTFKDMQKQMIAFNLDLRKLLDENPAVQDGEITARYKEHDKLIHIHRVTKGDNDIVVFKNFADTLYNNNYSSLGFPKEGEWIEILNSDDVKYGGGGNVNKGKVFSDNNQNFSFAPNSIIVMKRVK